MSPVQFASGTVMRLRDAVGGDAVSKDMEMLI